MFPGGVNPLRLAMVGSLLGGGAWAEETSQGEEGTGYEDYHCDFGNTLNGKLSALWRATDRVNVRSTVSTGFRAPSPGQANLRAVTTGFSGTGGLTEQGQVPPTHPIAAALGGVELTEEKSVGFSVGTAMEVAHDIALEDRIALTGSHEPGPWDGRVRPGCFSGWQACRFRDNSCGDLGSFGGGVIVDAEAGYAFGGRHRVALGAQNILDTMPETDSRRDRGRGNLRPESTPWDYKGAFWYARLFVDL